MSANKERWRDQTEPRSYNCHQRGLCPSALYCGVMKTSGAEGQGGAGGAVGDGVLGVGEV